MAAGDTDGDGDADIVAAFDTRVVWYENLDRGLFSTAKSIADLSSTIKLMHLNDVDLDGDMDVIGVNDWIHVLENNGGGQFELHEYDEHIAHSHEKPASIGDIDGRFRYLDHDR